MRVLDVDEAEIVQLLQNVMAGIVENVAAGMITDLLEDCRGPRAPP
jgi:hypothetical protein